MRGVEFPEQLIEAHRAGNLVIFVGAGASVAPPSSLPLFSKLAKDIAAEVHVGMSKEDEEHPDSFLGRLDRATDKRTVDVHAMVERHVDIPGSAPNRLHFALADLAIAGGPVRMVTTNYDHHLSTALAQRGHAVEEYVAPALPVGYDFTGLVYVHGKLGGDSSRLVVTDKDFGRGYMTDAWAARFLEQMFNAHTALFVGYSMNDVVMGYLTRALRPGTARYALTDDPGHPRWASAEVTPIGFEVVGGSYDALHLAVEEWAAQSAAKLLDHRQRLVTLLAAPPSSTPQDESYLDATLADADRTRLFVELAQGREWLDWLAKRPEFQSLLDPATVTSERGRLLADWVADKFLQNDQDSGLVLDVVHQGGGRLSRDLAMAVCTAVSRAAHPRPVHLQVWLALLVQYVPDVEADWLAGVLATCVLPDDRLTALMLFDHLTDPMVTTRPTFGMSNVSRFDIRLRRADAYLRETWREVFTPLAADVARDVLLLVEGKFHRLYRLLASTGGVFDGWDAVSRGRTAIEPHEQDQHDDPLDVLIDAARDSLETLLAAGDPSVHARLDAWTAGDVMILRRLAVHGWIARTDIDAAAKLTWLRDNGFLFDHPARHEVFRLLQLTLPETNDKAVAAVVDRVLAEPLDGDSAEYMRFNILAWIARHAPESQTAQKAVLAHRQAHPDFAEREHPDLLSWWSVGFTNDLPFTAAQLHEKINADAAAVVAELVALEDAPASLTGAAWYEVFRLVAGVVREHPDDGDALVAAGGSTTAVVNAVVEGWASTVDGPETAEKFLTQVEKVDLALVTELLVRVLGGRLGITAERVEWAELPAAQQLADELWSLVEQDPLAEDAARALAEFWIGVVHRRWQAASDTWTGMTLDLQDRFELMLGSDAHGAADALVADLVFFHAADPAWAIAQLLPLFDWSDPARAARSWTSFLEASRPNQQLLQDGMLGRYTETVDHLKDLEPRSRDLYLKHVVHASLDSGFSPLSWLRQVIAEVSPAERTAWATEVGRMLRQLDAAAAEENWARWIQNYWQDRLNSIPNVLTTAEASVMSGWVLCLTTSFNEGVALTVLHEAGLSSIVGGLAKLTRDRVSGNAPEFGVWLAHLLKGTQKPYHGLTYVQQIFGWIKDDADPANLSDIRNEAMRLGATRAATW